MNNFRKHRVNKHRPSAVDGFITSAHPAADNENFSFRRSYSPSSRMTVDNFKRPEGFHASQQGVIAVDAPRSLGRQPRRDADGKIDLAIPEAPSKRRFGRRSRARTSRFSRRKALKGVLILFILSVITVGYLFGKGYLKARQIFKGGGNAAALQENVDPARLNGEGDGRVNILLLGKGGTGHTAPDLTDTILIASIDPIHNDAALLSIPRDLYVKVPRNGSMKINSVYATAKNEVLGGRKVSDQAKKAEDAGFKAIEETVESTMGIPIHYHVMVNFNGFKQAIDAVGGVDVNVTAETALRETMRIDGRMYTLDVKTGVQHFDGFRALAYARSRLTSPRGDFDRAERQRLILVALKEKIFSVGTFSNPVTINKLIDSVGNNVQTNISMEKGEVMRLYEIGKKIDGSKMQSIGLADPPNNFLITSSVNGLSVVIPRTGVGNYKEIQAFVRNTLKDSFIRNENATIAVLNGTSISGLAARTAEELKSYGYNISQVADSPIKNQQTTVIVNPHGSNKKYTKAYLEKRFKVKIVNELPDSRIEPGNADFVIILGTNEQARLEN